VQQKTLDLLIVFMLAVKVFKFSYFFRDFEYISNLGITAELEVVLNKFLTTNKQKCDRQTFSFVHFNHYSAINHESYIPAEFALVTFSLVRGVQAITEQLIDPGKLSFFNFLLQVFLILVRIFLVCFFALTTISTAEFL